MSEIDKTLNTLNTKIEDPAQYAINRMYDRGLIAYLNSGIMCDIIRETFAPMVAAGDVARLECERLRKKLDELQEASSWPTAEGERKVLREELAEAQRPECNHEYHCEGCGYPLASFKGDEPRIDIAPCPNCCTPKTDDNYVDCGHSDSPAGQRSHVWIKPDEVAAYCNELRTTNKMCKVDEVICPVCDRVHTPPYCGRTRHG